MSAGISMLGKKYLFNDNTSYLKEIAKAEQYL